MPSDLLKRLEASYERLGATFELAKHNRFAPASDDELARIAAVSGVPLPSDLDDYLRSLALGHPFVGSFRALSPKEIAAQAERLHAMSEGGAFDEHLAKIRSWNDGRWNDNAMQQTYWSAGWIPIAEDGGGNLLCFDLTPGEGGTVGQLVEVEFQDGQGPTRSPYPDLTTYLQVHLKMLEDGLFQAEDEEPLEYDEPPREAIRNARAFVEAKTC